MIFRAPKNRAARVAVVVLLLACVSGGALALGLGRGLLRGRGNGAGVTKPPATAPASRPSSDAEQIAAAWRELPAFVTFNRDVAPIVFEHCSGCHRPGEAAPFNLLNYADVKKHAAQIADVTARRYMPPWLPEPLESTIERATPGSTGIALPGAADWGPLIFLGERRLTPRQIAMLGKWVQQGAVEGEMTHLPPPPRFTEGWQLGTPDLVVEMPEAYTLAADGPDVYRNFVVPVNLPEAQWVRTIEFRPGNPKVVHHAVVLVDPANDARRNDAKDPGVGFAGMTAGDTAGIPEGHFMSWQPGKVAQATGNLAWRLRRGSDLVLQMHMRPSGKPETVKAKVGLYFTTRAPVRRPARLLLRSVTHDIPPGASDYAIENSYVLPVDVDVLAVLPHAHYLGKELRAWATIPSGQTQELVHIRNWNFNWQGDYRYIRPISLPRGTVLSMRYTYDNSEQNPHNPNHPPRRVVFGAETSDEMGEFWLQVLTRSDPERQYLIADYIRNWSTRDSITLQQQTLRQNPKDIEALINLGRALGVAGKDSEARERFQQALQIDPRNARAHYYLGTLYQDRGQISHAMVYLEEAVRLDPDDFRARINLGILLLAERKQDRAEEHFQAALRLNPGDVNARTNLGLVAFQRGDLARAETWFEEALRFDPDDFAAKENLTRVRGLLKGLPATRPLPAAPSSRPAGRQP